MPRSQKSPAVVFSIGRCHWTQRSRSSATAHKASLRRTSYSEFVPEDTGANSGTGLFMKQRNTQQEDLSVAHGMGNVVHSGTRGRGCTDPVVLQPGTGWHPSCPVPGSDPASTAAARTGSNSRGKLLCSSPTFQENQCY